MKNGDEIKEKRAKKFAYDMEVINYILLAADCPIKFRTYIDSLLGIANGDFEFEASDSEVAARATGKAGKAGKAASKDWARDKRRDLVAWQKENGIRLLTMIPGSRDKNVLIKTSFQLHLLKYAEQVTADAGNNKYAIKSAAEKLVKELRAQYIDDSQNPKYINPNKEVLKYIRTSKTNLESAAKMLKRYDFKLMREDEQLLNEMEKSIAEIKARGFVDDILDFYIFDRIERDDP